MKQHQKTFRPASAGQLSEERQLLEMFVKLSLRYVKIKISCDVAIIQGIKKTQRGSINTK